jgi:hypothetical protein
VDPVESRSPDGNLRLARIAAVKANPALLTQAAHLSEKMRAFMKKLEAAIIKTDLNVAPVIAKIENTHPGPGFSHPPLPAR